VLQNCKLKTLKYLNYIKQLKKDLTYTTFNLSNILPDHIWNNIQKHHMLAFRRCNTTMFLTHKKKFEWLLHKTVQKNMKKIKPFKFSCITNKNTHTKLLKFNDIEPFTTANETLIRVNLIPSFFSHKVRITYLTTPPSNQKWFKNLSIDIPPVLESITNGRYV